MKEIKDTESDIEVIVRRIQRGINVEENFQRLFGIYYRRVCHFFERRGFSSDESRDLTQETFIRVYQGIGAFRHDAPFGAWLFLIAANVQRNLLRHRSAQKRAAYHLALVDPNGDDEESSGGETREQLSTDVQTPLGDLLQGEKERMLRAAVESLPDQMRRCMMLRVYQDLSYQEIGTVMRISAETVKAHLYQARRQLREKLADYFVVPES